MSLTIKVPVKEMEREKPVMETVEHKLSSDRGNAYTIAGIMIECFGVKQEDIDKSFSKWKKGDPTLYSRIRKALDTLTEQGKIKQAKRGMAVHYWWVAKEKMFP